MRKIKYLLYLSLIALAIVNVQCSEDKLDVFGQEKYIFIDNEEIEDNTILFSFAIDPDATEKEIQIPIKYVGRLLEGDLNYSVSFDADSTTMPENEFDIPKTQTFHKGNLKDTLVVTVKRGSENKVLRVKLVSNDNFIASTKNRTYIDVAVTNVLAKPLWWTSNITKAYLGEYSKKKYVEFFKVTKVEDFGALNPSEQRYYALKFKYYLQEKKANGETIVEEDGSEMIVTVIG